MACSQKTQYRRSTPVVRLQRNVLKLERHAQLVNSRLSSWVSEDNNDLAAAMRHTSDIIRSLCQLKDEVEGLVKLNFVPPKRSAALIYEEGDKVSVVQKHRSRYEPLFEKTLKEDPSFLDELVVFKVLPTGEIAVRHGQRTPFIVRKSHLVAV